MVCPFSLSLYSTLSLCDAETNYNNSNAAMRMRLSLGPKVVVIFGNLPRNWKGFESEIYPIALVIRTTGDIILSGIGITKFNLRTQDWVWQAICFTCCDGWSHLDWSVARGGIYQQNFETKAWTLYSVSSWVFSIRSTDSTSRWEGKFSTASKERDVDWSLTIYVGDSWLATTWALRVFWCIGLVYLIDFKKLRV